MQLHKVLSAADRRSDGLEPQSLAPCRPPGSDLRCRLCPGGNEIKPLPDHGVAPLLRADDDPAQAGGPAGVAAGQGGAPFWTTEGDYSVMWRGTKVGRISYDHKPYAGEEHARWRWFLNDTQRNRMANGRCATREERWRRSDRRSMPWRTIRSVGRRDHFSGGFTFGRCAGTLRVARLIAEVKAEV